MNGGQMLNGLMDKLMNDYKDGWLYGWLNEKNRWFNREKRKKKD